MLQNSQVVERAEISQMTDGGREMVRENEPQPTQTKRKRAPTRIEMWDNAHRRRRVTRLQEQNNA